jgi:ABC-type glutathione transport system ATPase component
VFDVRHAALGETREQYQQALEDAVEARSGAQLKIEVIRKTVAATRTRTSPGHGDCERCEGGKIARLRDRTRLSRRHRRQGCAFGARSLANATATKARDQRRTRDRRHQDHAGVCEALEARIKAHRTGSSVVVETGSRPFVFIAEVEKTYRARSRGLKAVDGVPSGCGKSTLLMMTSGLIPISAGRIVIQGQPVHRTHTAV